MQAFLVLETNIQEVFMMLLTEEEREDVIVTTIDGQHSDGTHYLVAEDIAKAQLAKIVGDIESILAYPNDSWWLLRRWLEAAKKEIGNDST